MLPTATSACPSRRSSRSLSRVATMTRTESGRRLSCFAYFLLIQRSNSRIRVAETPRSWPLSRKYSERL